MATQNNRTNDVLSIQQEEATTCANKYHGLVLKKKPLISKDSKRAWFDSADWALNKQEASPDERKIAAIENLKPKYFQRIPSKKLPHAFASGQENQATTCANKYHGLVLKKKPLISKDSKRAWFDSADWALNKQEASPDERKIAAIENLKPKYFQRIPPKKLPHAFAFGQENQATTCANKYHVLVLKKKPLIMQDSKRAWFDSADWALHKQEASSDERKIAAIENLKPIYFQRIPPKKLPPTFASGQEKQTDSNI